MTNQTEMILDYLKSKSWFSKTPRKINRIQTVVKVKGREALFFITYSLRTLLLQNQISFLLL